MSSLYLRCHKLWVKYYKQEPKNILFGERIYNYIQGLNLEYAKFLKIITICIAACHRERKEIMNELRCKIKLKERDH